MKLFNIENWMKLSEKEIYKRYTIIMAIVIAFQITIMILIKDLKCISMGIGLGFNIGIWVGYSLRRLVK